MNTLDKQPFHKSVGFLFASYWTILVAWQNISRSETRSNIDIVIKIGLLLYFTVFYLKRSSVLHSNILLVFVIGATLMITATRSEDFSLSILISYIYPLLFMTMVYSIGNHFVIIQKHLIIFCNWIIVVVLYASIYALIFCREQFVNAFSVSNAYGNELSSFFISSHEYGLYLVAGIVSSFLCLTISPAISPAKALFYIAALAVFAVNLILTFSRTSLLSLAIFLIIFAVFGKGSLRRWIIVLSISCIIIVFCSPKLSSFVFDIVLKGNNLAGRDTLFDAAIDYYASGSFVDKLFGFGITSSRDLFSSTLNHGSVHNAYLQILLYYGAIGLSALVLFLLSQIMTNIRLFRKNRFWGSIFLGLNLSAAAIMFTNTTIIFTSPIDSYFLTIFMFIVPKYVRNALNQGVFDNPQNAE